MGLGPRRPPPTFSPVTSDFLLPQPPAIVTFSGRHLTGLFGDGPMWGPLTPSESWRFVADFYFSTDLFHLPVSAIQDVGTRGLMNTHRTLTSQACAQIFLIPQFLCGKLERFQECNQSQKISKINSKKKGFFYFSVSGLWWGFFFC